MIEFQYQRKKNDPATFDMSLGMRRIVFMGTPEFAVASLDALRRAGFQIVGVVTAPDRPAGRGMKPGESAVKKYAVEHQIPLLQPEKLKSPEFLQALADWKADLQVVVAFRMLPEVVWSMPPMGTINLHGSLLPQYRGAAPINWAVINGETETGVTTFQLQHEIDTGNILLQRSFPIAADDTAGNVHDRMKEIGAELLVETVQGLFEQSLTPKPQSEVKAGELRHAPKIFTDTCRISFEDSAQRIHNLVRGLSPFPGAFTELEGKTLKIFKGRPLEASHSLVPGAIDTDRKTYFRFACSDGFYEVKEMQLEGKKRMQVEDFLRGYR